MDTYVIVGAGQAGAHAGVAMRRAGFAGRIVLVGDETHAPYDRPPLSKGFMVGQGASPVYFFDAGTYAAEDIELRLGTRAEAIEPSAGRVCLSDGSTLSYDRLILATGSSARSPTMAGAGRVLTLRTLDDAGRIRSAFEQGQRVVCIGAGVIGLEIASAARRHSCAVTVVELNGSVMSRSLDPELAGAIEAIHRRAGVELLFDAEVVAVEPDAVVLLDGRRIDADVVVAGIGIRRNIDLARQAGIPVAAGILTEPSGLTGRDGIYAAGEVAEFQSVRAGRHLTVESWRHAREHGAAVGRVVAGLDETYDEVPWFWSDQHGANIQVAGQAIGAERLIYRGDPTADSFSAFLLDADSRLVGAFGLNAGRDVSAALRLLRLGTRVSPEALRDLNIAPQKLIAAASIPESVP